jgi:DNA-binding transcriptional MerR regulator
MDYSGYTRAEVAAMLNDIGYDISFEQLRKYEQYGLFEAPKADNNYRIYPMETIREIHRVCSLKLCGLSLKKIKEFLEIEKKILQSPLLCKMEVGVDQESGEKIYIKILPPPDTEGEPDAKYDELCVLVDRYRNVCRFVRDRIPKAKRILEQGLIDISEREKAVNRIMEIAEG